jgi:hypothetical protein
MAARVMTKSKGVGRGGRRKGSGRPRQTKAGKTATITTRVDPELKKRIEDEKRRILTKRPSSLLTLSQTIGLLLTYGLDERARRESGDSANQGLVSLINEVVQFANANARAHWRSDRFAFEVLRAALQQILVILSGYVPPGPLTPSKKYIDEMMPLPSVQKAIEQGEDLAPIFGSAGIPSTLDPEAVGQYIAKNIWIRAQQERFDETFNAILPSIRELLSVPNILTPAETLDARFEAALEYSEGKLSTRAPPRTRARRRAK